MGFLRWAVDGRGVGGWVGWWVGGGVLGGPVLSYQSAADEKALTAAV